MDEKMVRKDRVTGERSGIVLEQRLIVEFLAERELTLADLKTLAGEEARKLRIEASKYASARLAELEARARFINAIHDATRKITG